LVLTTQIAVEELEWSGAARVEVLDSDCVHSSKKKGFSENVQKAIVGTCFFMFVLTTCNL
jgi:hypothetical protein